MKRRTLKRSAIGAACVTLILVLLAMLLIDFDSFGGTATGDRLARMKTSPQYHDGRFANPDPARKLFDGNFWGSLKEWLFDKSERRPQSPLPSVIIDPASFAEPPTDLTAWWLGHSTVLVEIDGARLLIDPVFEKSASTIGGGAKRFQPTPITRENLPPVDAVIISHDHYDHLEMSSVRFFAARGVCFFVPLGVGAHLETWDVPPEQIIELDWGDSRRLANLQIICTPARHFSGRGLFDRNKTLWSSWTVIGPKHRLFYSGDTGLSDHLAEIGSNYGPFDLTIIQIGAYGDAWPDIHLYPEDAIDIQLALQGRAMLPVHWGTFDLALHTWDDPINRAVKAAQLEQVKLLTPKLGETIRLGEPFSSQAWWEDVH